MFKSYLEIPTIRLTGVIGHTGMLRSGLNINNLNISTIFISRIESRPSIIGSVSLSKVGPTLPSSISFVR